MILDTNALSAWAEGDRAIEPVLRSATEMMIPAVVLGEFEFGIRQSRHYRRYADWLHSNLGSVEVVAIDRDVAQAYGAVRVELKKAGTPIPTGRQSHEEVSVVAEHPRSAARDLGRTTPPDSIASPLHRLVQHFPSMEAAVAAIAHHESRQALERLCQRLLRSLDKAPL